VAKTSCRDPGQIAAAAEASAAPKALGPELLAEDLRRGDACAEPLSKDLRRVLPGDEGAELGEDLDEGFDLDEVLAATAVDVAGVELLSEKVGSVPSLERNI
jgi:hypothetical protein